jgi:hypothetical protein
MQILLNYSQLPNTKDMHVFVNFSWINNIIVFKIKRQRKRERKRTRQGKFVFGFCIWNAWSEDSSCISRNKNRFTPLHES